ncbi:hypothetical protein ACFV4G_01430 [Kitasatospora sp. NPDC059747]|uniref:hypothetical protein n=1 Tax=Kitasatospora sp. NPDC059747 TaxID=3346930 RepID=UPI00364644A4
MHLPPLLAAIERGDDDAAFDPLSDVPLDEMAGDDAVDLLAAAAHAGRHEVVRWLVEDGVDVALRGDERGLPVLDGIRRGIKNHWSPGAGRLADIDSMLRARARSAG